MSLYRFSWIRKGELAAMAMPNGSYEDFEQLRQFGIGAIVTLTVRPLPGEKLNEFEMEYLHLPIPNFSPPEPEQIRQFLDFCETNRRQGRAVAVHCLAGVGRTGTMLSCYLVSKGMTAEQAIRTVRRKRPGSIETLSQEEAVYRFARELEEQSES